MYIDPISSERLLGEEPLSLLDYSCTHQKSSEGFLIDHRALHEESPRTVSIMRPLTERRVNNLIRNLLFDFLDYWINVS